ncbi:MAG: YifB family Mg chelatase-like AAA ATPase [Gammaproteobacteria bacterium]|nr:MAG: YifB family Mg chelatase-like AAA ATPase [Gammaproteobacteria bacterium]
MSLALVYSRAQTGMDAPLVTVEVHISNGLPALSIVGLPETAVRESKDRVRGAILNSQFEFPARRITINLAPADLPKEGGRFDLPIALGILAASGQIPARALQDYEFAGELALSGELRAVHGILPMTLQTCAAGRTVVVPGANAAEAALVSAATVHAPHHLLEITAHLAGDRELARSDTGSMSDTTVQLPDLADVRGQHHARRALEIAAAGGHSLLMIGPPGTGKSLLASRLHGILPPLSEEEALESAAIRSVSGLTVHPYNWRIRSFRSPHHTASAVALVGGGSNPRPGEISLAHHGVLFLDEFPEFERRVLEALREPLETGHIMISRAARQVEYPARFQLVAAMNPCPCSWLGDPSGRCHCTSEQIQRYRNRISGPLLDRIDMHVEVPRLSFDEMQGPKGEYSSAVRKRVTATRGIQQLDRNNTLNSQLNNRQIDDVCNLNKPDRLLLQQAMEKLDLSARAYHRILKLARTIADMDEAGDISKQHLTEAISYRVLDRYL